MGKKTVFILITLLLVALVLTGCPPKTTEDTDTTDTDTTMEETKETYKIGVVLSKTGNYAGLGGPENNVIEMEVENVNNAGGINGYQLEVIIEDDETDADKANKAATKLIESDGVICILGTSGSGESLAIAAVASGTVPQVALGGANVLSNPVKEWLFQIPWPARLVVEPVIDYLKTNNITKVAILTLDNGYGKDGKKDLEAKLPEAGIEIVANETYKPGDLDMKAQLTKVQGTDAGALVVWDAGGGAPIVPKNMAELEMDIPYIGSHGIANKRFIDGAGEAANGVIFPAGKIIMPELYGEGTEAKALADKFYADYENKYGEAPDGTFPGHAYDGFYVVVRALERLNLPPSEVTPQMLRDEIENTQGLVLTGGIFNYSAEDHAGTQPSDLVMYLIENGAWTEVK